jgi:hypothetical protein
LLALRAELDGGEGGGSEGAIAGWRPEQKSVRPLDGTAIVTRSVGGSLLVPLPKLVTTRVTSARNPFSKDPLPLQVPH